MLSVLKLPPVAPETVTLPVRVVAAFTFIVLKFDCDLLMFV